VYISSFVVDFPEIQKDSENLIVAKIIVLTQIECIELFFKVFLAVDISNILNNTIPNN
jgi:hypothetical protein